MDASLDEDFVNFESVAQRCSSATLTSSTDEEISLLDNEASQRERKVQGGKKIEEKNNNNNNHNEPSNRKKMKPPSGGLESGGEAPSPPPEYHLFTTFSYNSTSKRLTMIPVKYKIKEERRKVLKISVNKLKKIDDPESWLCRSVLINNTMKKLQKETRDEKLNKQMTYAKNYLPKASEDFGCQNNNNDSTNNNNIRSEVSEDSECFYQEGGEFISNTKTEEFLFGAEGPEGKAKPAGDKPEEKLDSSISGSVSINEDFVENIPSIKRCASRKKSLDEDGTANEILNLDAELVLNAKSPELEDVDDCDVHDVLSQLYMPPTPRMLTSIDSDTDDDELNVVDIDSSYIDNECPKLPSEGLFEGVKRQCEVGAEEEDATGSSPKRRKIDEVLNCFNEDFLCGNRSEDNERTSGGESGKEARGEEELIELEDEEDIKRRLSQSLSSHYHRKPEKTCDNFFDEGCDNQYSCGHTVTMFGDMQSVTFHNLIASLET